MKFIREIYQAFDEPLTALDCGLKCAPHNPSGKPFCCDICQVVPTVYETEWRYLQTSGDFWHVYRGDECADDPCDPAEVLVETPEHMLLLACQGPERCRRSIRSISCRQFPFFPYITADDRFIGLAYNWDFEPFCWVISNLDQVSTAFRQEFIQTFDALLGDWPDEYDSYYYLSEDMRAHFSKIKRRIPILHRNGGYYLLSPKNDRLYRVEPGQFKRFGPY